MDKTLTEEELRNRRADFEKKKKMKRVRALVRAGIQIIFFLTMPSVYSSAFSGVKYIFSRMGCGESIKLTAFLTVLILMAVYTCLFGRFFCGFACAFGSLCDFVHFCFCSICKKLKLKTFKLRAETVRWILPLKYLILAALVFLTFSGKENQLTFFSPWTVFSRWHSLNFEIGSFGGGVIILLLILAGCCLEERFFCKCLCPMGAVFSLIPVLPVFVPVRVREQCLRGCKACHANCPVHIELPEKGRHEMLGECIQCQKCVDVCPKDNARMALGKMKGNEISLTAFKAVILFALLKWIGI